MLVLEFLLVNVHVFLEYESPSRFEIYLLGYLIWDVSKVDKDHDHVRLGVSQELALLGHTFLIIRSNFYQVLVAIFDKFFSLFNEGADVVECILVKRVGKDLVPWCALDFFLWLLGVVTN